MNALLIFAAAGTLAAQNPPRPPGPRASFDAIEEYLSLSDSQVDQLRQLMRSRAESNRARVEEMQTKQRELGELLRQGTTDATAAGKLMLEVESARKQIRGADDGFASQARAILNDAQKAKLKALEDAAKLLPAVHEAGVLGLVERPEGAAGPLPARAPGFPARARFGPRN